MKNRETDEWLAQNQRSTRNFIRKWGTMVEHDEYLKPIITPVYNIGFELTEAADVFTIRELEPYCSYMVVPLQRKYYNILKKNNQTQIINWIKNYTRIFQIIQHTI